MVGNGSRKAAGAVLRLIRDLVLIIAVGALGARLLIALNGGKPIGTEALAFAEQPAQPVLRVASLDIDLDPRNPVEVRSVYLELVMASDTAPQHLRLSPAPGNRVQYACNRETPSTWHCPTPGLKLADFDRFVVIKS